MSLEHIEADSEYVGHCGRFDVKLRPCGRESLIDLTYNSFETPVGAGSRVLKSSYHLNFIQMQTTQPVQIALESMRDCLNGLKKQTNGLEWALDSRETYKKLSKLTAELIERSLNDHERKLKEDKEETTNTVKGLGKGKPEF